MYSEDQQEHTLLKYAQSNNLQIQVYGGKHCPSGLGKNI